MPHQCTTCGRTFADGSKEMLSGCPDCGGNKFQFKPASARTTGSTSTADDADAPTPESRSDPAPANRTGSPPTDAGVDPADTPSSTTSPSSEPSSTTSDPATTPAPDSNPSTAPDSSSSRSTAAEDDEHDAEVEHRTDDPRPPAEDFAQASARTDMVSPDELADAASKPRQTPDEADGRVIEPQSEERPGLDELREELNSQFESIKIVSPGQYELNLMELYDRQEYIISLQEDGRYVIEVPGSWGDRDDD